MKTAAFRPFSSGILAERVEIERSVPESVPAAARRSDGKAHGRRAFILHGKCLYFVYLIVRGEVAERLKAAVC